MLGVLMIVGCTAGWVVELIKVAGCFLFGLKGVHNDVGLTVVERTNKFWVAEILIDQIEL